MMYRELLYRWKDRDKIRKRKEWDGDKTGTRWGQDRDKIGTRQGQDRDKTGARWGQDRNKEGTRNKQDRDRIRTWHGHGRDMTGMMGTKQTQDWAFRGLKKFSGGWWWWLKVIIVSVHVLYFSFTPIYVRQDRLSVTPVYISLRLCWWAGTWSSTTR